MHNTGSYALDLTPQRLNKTMKISASTSKKSNYQGIENGPNQNTYLSHVSGILEAKATNIYCRKFQLDESKSAISGIVTDFSRASEK